MAAPEMKKKARIRRSDAVLDIVAGDTFVGTGYAVVDIVEKRTGSGTAMWRGRLEIGTFRSA